MSALNDKEQAFQAAILRQPDVLRAFIDMLNGDKAYCMKALAKTNIPDRDADVLRGRIDQCNRLIRRTEINERDTD